MPPPSAHHEPGTDRSSRLTTFRNAFFSGVLLLAPLYVTVWVFHTIIVNIGGPIRSIYEPYIPKSLLQQPFFWDFATTLVVLLLVTALGYVSHYVFGKFFLRIGERAVQKIPGVGAVYNSVKQIVTTFGSQKNTFSKVVLVEFPRKGVWTLGFLTNKEQGEAQTVAGSDTWTVFVPTTPNPTSGFLLMLPRHEVVELEMTVGEGMKMIISGGAVMPPWPAARPVEVAKA